MALLTGCGGIEPTHVGGAQRTACERLVRSLPAHVADQGSLHRDIDAPGATWGDPAITLRCGVGTPAGLTATSHCQTVGGVDWYVPDSDANDQSRTLAMTTVGRLPRVEVTLPAAYRPPAAAMVDLGPAIRAHTRRTTPCS